MDVAVCTWELSPNLLAPNIHVFMTKAVHIFSIEAHRQQPAWRSTLRIAHINHILLLMVVNTGGTTWCKDQTLSYLMQQFKIFNSCAACVFLLAMFCIAAKSWQRCYCPCVSFTSVAIWCLMMVALQGRNTIPVHVLRLHADPNTAA